MKVLILITLHHSFDQVVVVVVVVIAVAVVLYHIISCTVGCLAFCLLFMRLVYLKYVGKAHYVQVGVYSPILKFRNNNNNNYIYKAH